MNKTIDEKFKAARKLFPAVKNQVYFNAASTGPLCRPVRKAIDKYFDLCQILNRDADNEAYEDLKKIRQLGAGIIGARRDEVGFGWNTGYGLNIAAQGLPLKSGDEVLLSDIEFPSNVYPWMALRERGVKVKFVKSVNRCFDINNLEKAITKKSRVLSLSLVQFFNGFKNDLKTIGEICRANNIYFVVDGIQGCGVEPIDVHKWNIDMFAAGGQKWLLGQLGSGIFYIRKDLQKQLRRSSASWLGVNWNLDFSNLFSYDRPFFDSARGFESGTYPYAQVHALAASLELITSLGVRSIQKHNYRLIDLLVEYLKSKSKFKIVSNLNKIHRSSIISFASDNTKRLHQQLWDNKIICSYRENAIRVSIHLYNNESDMKKLIRALNRFSE